MPITEITTAEPDAAAVLALFEELALEAGRRIMQVYGSAIAVERKLDSTPVTDADRRAEDVILRGLRAAFPAIPCVAEEEACAGLAPDDPGELFFLVDPLDGTREFIARTPDFTVNLALVRNSEPIAGVVYAPARGTLYAGADGRCVAVSVSTDHAALERRPIAVRKPAAEPMILASRSHRTPETDSFIAGFYGAKVASVGSSLKFCLLAAGEADLYPRFGPTMEWDTAAGDAILRAAGGSTRTVEGEPLVYGNRNRAGGVDYANPWFVSRGGEAS